MTEAKKTETATKEVVEEEAKSAGSTDKLSDYKDKAVDRARLAANDGKDKATGAIGGLGKMIEDSAQTLDENVGEKYGDYARSAAEAVSSFAEKVNAKDVDEIVEDARGFVKKSPVVAIGAAAAVGFVVARLIKAGMDNKS